MNKNWFLTICTVLASFVFTVTANAQVVVYGNDFEDGNMLAEIGSETLVEESSTVSIVPVDGAPDATLGNNVLLLDQNMIDLELTLNLTDTLSLTDGNTEGNVVNRFVLGERGSLGVGAEASRQRPGFSILNDMGNSVNMPFGTPPGTFWWGSDATPDTFDAGRAAHMSLTIGASTFDFSTTSQGGVEFNGTEFSNFDGAATEIATVRICSFGALYGGYFDNIRVAGVVADDVPVMLGDVDLSGEVNFSDISPFIAVLSGGGFQAEADIDQNGLVDFGDISPFISLLSAP